MKYRFLGNSGLRVSEICFGAMSFTGKSGWSHIANTDQKTADEMTALVIDSGVNFFDTADIYSNGQSEIMLGKALGNKRKEIVITTKFGFRMNDSPNGDGLSRKRIIEACEASLLRLNTDYIDVYMIHSWDFVTPLEETLSTLDRLVKQGKVRYLGCSNFAGWQLMKAMALCEKNGWERFINLQAYYSLLGREIELEIVPVCLDQGIGITPWSPLHGGVLSGKYHRTKDWPQGTRINTPNDVLPYDQEKGEKILDEVLKIANDRGVTASQVSLNYLIRKPAIASLVIGARTFEQFNDNRNSVEWEMSDEEVSRLDALSVPPNIYPFWYFDIFRKERTKDI